jgi:hypothetical protein
MFRITAIMNADSRVEAELMDTVIRSICGITGTTLVSIEIEEEGD